MSVYSDLDNRPDPLRKRKLYFRYFAELEGRVLDIGCSTGNFIQHSPSRILGVDRDHDGLAVAATRGFTVVRANVEMALPFADGSARAVNCDSVLEHLNDPVRLVREVFRVLEPGGIAIIVTPNIYRVRHRFWRDYTHRSPFCPESLKRLVYDAGFRHMSVQPYSLNYLKALARRTPGWRTGRQPVWWFLEDAIAYPFAGNMILRAVKDG